MSHVPTVLKSDRSVFDKMLRVDDNGRSINPILYGPRREKTCLQARGFTNTKGANKPAHMRSLISAFAIRLMKSIIYEALPGVLGKRGTGSFISREQGNKCHFSGEQGNKQ